MYMTYVLSFTTKMLRLVSNVQQIKWHFLLNKRLLQPYLRLLQQKIVRFITKARPSNRSIAVLYIEMGKQYNLFKQLLGFIS